MSIKDLKGMRFGNLVVLEFKGTNKFNKAQWLCQCDCGNTTIVISSFLTRGRTKSCGCKKGNKGTKVSPINVGDTFGKLTTISKEGSDKFGNTLWLCQCDCGNTTIVTGHNLRKGITKSCGCIQTIKGDREIHNKLTNVLRAMKARCNNPKCWEYQWYGQRGIKVCKEWQTLKAFKEWALNNGYQIGLTIDRIDVNGDYEPSNCRWVTMKEQCINKRDNVLITYKDKTQTIREWADELGMKYTTFRGRLIKGWTIEEAIETPLCIRGRRNIK